MQRFQTYPEVERVIAAGTTRGTVILRSGLQVDLRILPLRSYGAALHYFTGSKAHNIAVRTLGVERGLRISEYGIFRVPKDKKVEEAGVEEGEHRGTKEETFSGGRRLGRRSCGKIAARSRHKNTNCRS
jgi:DNA polymerase/3'-5' exonuclease PolX